MTFKIFLQNKKRNVRYLARNFAKSSFSDATKYQRIRVASDTESNGLNLILRIRVTAEEGLGNLFVTSSRAHFFNQTDLEQYFFIEQLSKKKTRPRAQYCLIMYPCRSNVLLQ